MERPATYWHMLPEYGQGRKAIWEAVNPHSGKRRIDEAFPKEIRQRTVDQTMTIEFINGSMWHVVGSDNYDSLVGSPPAGIVFSEWALADPAAYGFMSPILQENGGWVLWVYTARGRNHGYTTYQRAIESPDWYGQISRADETGVFTAAQLASERLDYQALYGKSVGDMLFEQEYLCSFEGATLGAYYAAEFSRIDREGRIGPVAIDRYVAVDTAWDIGVSDSSAIWFIQRVGTEIHAVDYYEASGVGLDHYAQVLRDRAEAGGYRYGKHYLPHDIQAREISSGKSRLETLNILGVKPVEVVPIHSKMDGINAVRRILDKCYFDRAKCERGIDALRQYRQDYDDKGRIFKANPLHDWTSHGSDAFRIYAAIHQDVKSLPSAYRRDKARPRGSWMAA
jgi:hypothetical protein